MVDDRTFLMWVAKHYFDGCDTIDWDWMRRNEPSLRSAFENGLAPTASAPAMSRRTYDRYSEI